MAKYVPLNISPFSLIRTLHINIIISPLNYILLHCNNARPFISLRVTIWLFSHLLLDLLVGDSAHTLKNVSWWFKKPTAFQAQTRTSRPFGSLQTQQQPALLRRLKSRFRHTLHSFRTQATFPCLSNSSQAFLFEVESRSAEVGRLRHRYLYTLPNYYSFSPSTAFPLSR